jgi:4-amino-4-deoxy-L-arabinose transferase-like glycosyltransferase
MAAMATPLGGTPAPGAGHGRRTAWLELSALAALTLLRFAAAARLPLSPDEAYYWVWSKALAAGYLDHPPMVALWIRLGTALLGDSALGVRLLGPLALAVGSVLLWRAAEDLLPGRGAGVTAAVLANATLLFGVGSVTMTPDTPLLFFWTGTVFACGRLLATGNAAWWLVAGGFAGAAMASKYTGLLLPPAVLLWLLLGPSLRSWLRRPAPWLGVLVAGVLFSPVLVWNAQHGWVSFLRQGGRMDDWQPARAPEFLGELLGGQIGLATPLLAALFGAGFWLSVRQARQGAAGSVLLATLLGVPSVVFLQHALGGRVQANWPSVLYPQAAIAAAGLAGSWRYWRAPAVALGFLLTAVIWVQALYSPAPLPAHWDPTLQRLAGWRSLAGEVTRMATADQARFVAVDNYGLAAEMAWHATTPLPVLAVGERWRWFAFADASALVAGREGVLLRSERRQGAPRSSAFTVLAPLQQLLRGRDGKTAEVLRLYRVQGRGGGEPVVLLPRRH